MAIRMSAARTRVPGYARRLPSDRFSRSSRDGAARSSFPGSAARCARETQPVARRLDHLGGFVSVALRRVIARRKEIGPCGNNPLETARYV